MDQQEQWMDQQEQWMDQQEQLYRYQQAELLRWKGLLLLEAEVMVW